MKGSGIMSSGDFDNFSFCHSVICKTEFLLIRFHPQLMKKKDPSVKQEEESHTAAVPPLPKTLECLECRLCSKKFTYLADIKAHVDESHKTEYRKSRCYKCKLGFINW